MDDDEEDADDLSMTIATAAALFPAVIRRGRKTSTVPPESNSEAATASNEQ